MKEELIVNSSTELNRCVESLYSNTFSLLLCYLCVVFVMHSRLFIKALWSAVGKGLTSCLLFMMFNSVFLTFPSGILGLVWYSIVSNPKLCHLC